MHSEQGLFSLRLVSRSHISSGVAQGRRNRRGWGGTGPSTYSAKNNTLHSFYSFLQKNVLYKTIFCLLIFKKL